MNKKDKNKRTFLGKKMQVEYYIIFKHTFIGSGSEHNQLLLLFFLFALNFNLGVRKIFYYCHFLVHVTCLLSERVLSLEERAQILLKSDTIK